MKRYQCNDFELPNRRPWTPPGCCPPQCPPQCPPPCPPPMPEPCPPQPPYPPHPPCPPLPPCKTGCVPTPWVLGGIYRAGQLVTYNGFLYVANVDNASGVPGESPDFTLLSTLQPIGPTGPAGPTGPTGPAGTVTPAAAVTDATSTTDVVTQFNTLLANMRTAGLLAT